MQEDSSRKTNFLSNNLRRIDLHMKSNSTFCTLALALISVSPVLADNWPQAGGPNRNWKFEKGVAPSSWSVAENRNIAWKTTLPNGGQGGIVVWKDRVFLTTFPEYQEGARKFSATILGHCLDAKTGKILWSVPLTGENESPMMYAYSDSTSWTPVTDGEHVWFFNCSGEMGCFDFGGHQVWRRKFRAPGEPFNKQHEPILYKDTIISLEPLATDEPKYRADRDKWHYLRGIDKNTGKTVWISEDATTYYCTSVFGGKKDGTPAILHGRGGPHDVPERPIGLSLTSLKPGEEGKTLWRYSVQPEPKAPVDGVTFQALYTMHWDQKFATCFKNAPTESLIVLDSETGKQLKTLSLVDKADFRQWDPAQKKIVAHSNISIRDMKDFGSEVQLKKGEVLHVFPPGMHLRGPVERQRGAAGGPSQHRRDQGRDGRHVAGELDARQHRRRECRRKRRGCQRAVRPDQRGRPQRAGLYGARRGGFDFSDVERGTGGHGRPVRCRRRQRLRRGAGLAGSADRAAQGPVPRRLARTGQIRSGPSGPVHRGDAPADGADLRARTTDDRRGYGGGGRRRMSTTKEKAASAAKAPITKAKVIAENRRAKFDYFLEDNVEAGIMLLGTEIKALRMGRANIAESYAAVEGREIVLINADIPPYAQANRFNHEPRRPRKLLLHRKQIDRLIGAVQKDGQTIIPIRLYLNEDGKAKLEIALAKGKKLHDKREASADRDWARDKARLMRDKG